MKKRNKALLVLLALVLVTGLGAKMYSNITMGDGEWVGLAADAGRIVFDDQATDRVSVMDANFGVGTTSPGYDIDILDDYGNAYLRVKSGSGDAGLIMDAVSGSDARVYWREANTNKWLLYYDAGINYLQLYNYGQASAAASFYDSGDIYLAPATGKVRVGGSAAPTYDLDVTGDIRATDDVFVGDDLDVAGAVVASQLTAEASILAMEDLVALDDVLAVGGVSVNEDIFTSAGDVVSSLGDVRAGSHVTATGNVYGTDVLAGGDITATDDVLAGGDVHATDDVIAGGDVHATGNVTATEKVQAGDAGYLAARGSMPFAAAVDGSGGYFFYTADVSADVDLTCNYCTETQIRRQVWVRWLVYDVSAQSTHYGEAVLEYLDVVVIADEGANDLELECLRGAPPNTEEYLQLDVVGNHTYEVVLMAMWQ